MKVLITVCFLGLSIVPVGLAASPNRTLVLAAFNSAKWNPDTGCEWKMGRVLVLDISKKAWVRLNGTVNRCKDRRIRFVYREGHSWDIGRLEAGTGGVWIARARRMSMYMQEVATVEESWRIGKKGEVIQLGEDGRNYKPLRNFAIDEDLQSAIDELGQRKGCL